MRLKEYFHPVEKHVAPKQPANTAVAPHRLAESALPSPSGTKFRPKQSSVPFALSTVELSTMPPRSSRSVHMSASGPLYPSGDFRNNSASQLSDIKADVMASWLHHRQQERAWTSGGGDEGVILKKARDNYVSCPSNLLEHRDGFYDSVKKLNVKVCKLHILHKATQGLRADLNSAL